MLTAYGEKKGEVGNVAKNGDDRARVKGFPGLVAGMECGTGRDWKAWNDWLFPATPENMRFLPDGSCLLQVDVMLQSPFFSRDDRPFYPTENVLPAASCVSYALPFGGRAQGASALGVEHERRE